MDASLVRRWALIHLALFVAAGVVFTTWPEIDLKAARLFYKDGRWIGSEQPGVEGFRRLLSVIVFIRDYQKKTKTLDLVGGLFANSVSVPPALA